MLISVTNWKLSFYNTFIIFKRKVCDTLFQRYLHEKGVLHTPTFHLKMNQFNIIFHMTRDK